MIKLTLNPNNQPLISIFHKPVVIIGEGGLSDVDLIIEHQSLQPVHVKIIEQEGAFFAINVANDPFVNLNGLPFGKRSIQNFDMLQIRDTSLRFEGLIENEKRLHEQFSEAFDLDKELSLLEESMSLGDLNTSPDIESLLRQIEPSTQDEQKDLVTKPFTEEKVPKKLLVKDYFLGESDDEDENLNAENHTSFSSVLLKAPKIFFHWKSGIAIFAAFMMVIALFSGAFYIQTSSRNIKEEILAAEGIADVAMTLKYTQIYHIKALKQNWSNPDFIKNNLANIITHDYSSLTNIDSQGHFTNAPYFLRIYTSSDFSQFLVIAQPSPSLLQWLIPKSSIIIDSSTMEMRKIPDFKALNRLLARTDPLDKRNAIEISNLVKQAQLIPLEFLANQRSDSNFSPPKALALIRPGAENHIYNAPRYYQLGETIMKKAVHLMETQSSGHDISRLKQEMHMLSKMSDLILYSSEGMQFATQAQKALAIFAPQFKFMTAYITFNSHGKLVSSHLLMDEDYSDVGLTDSSLKHDVSHFSNSSLTDSSSFEAFTAQNSENDTSHPLSLKLTSLSLARQHDLKHIHDKIIALLSQNFQEIVPNFSSLLRNLIQQYEYTDRDHQTTIAKSIAQLHHEFHDIPLSQFLEYVKAAGLEKLMEEDLRNQMNHPIILQVSLDSLDKLVTKIHNSENLKELEKNTGEINQWLSLEHLSEPEQVILYQNKVHTETIEKLNQLLLSPQKKPTMFTEDDRQTLIQILNSSWGNNEEEYEFYLHEFDLLKRKK